MKLVWMPIELQKMLKIIFFMHTKHGIREETGSSAKTKLCFAVFLKFMTKGSVLTHFVMGAPNKYLVHPSHRIGCTCAPDLKS